MLNLKNGVLLRESFPEGGCEDVTPFQLKHFLQKHLCKCLPTLDLSAYLLSFIPRGVSDQKICVLDEWSKIDGWQTHISPYGIYKQQTSVGCNSVLHYQSALAFS